MKYIKLYESFKEEYNKLINSYLEKINDCLIYLSDNYEVDVKFDNNKFNCRIKLYKQDMNDDLISNFEHAFDKINYEFDCVINSGIYNFNQDLCSVCIGKDKFIRDIESFLNSNKNSVGRYFEVFLAIDID